MTVILISTSFQDIKVIIFRSFLKGCDMRPEELDSIVNELYRKISSEIDCKTCAKRSVPCH